MSPIYSDCICTISVHRHIIVHMYLCIVHMHWHNILKKLWNIPKMFLTITDSPIVFLEFDFVHFIWTLDVRIMWRTRLLRQYTPCSPGMTFTTLSMFTYVMSYSLGVATVSIYFSSQCVATPSHLTQWCMIFHTFLNFLYPVFAKTF